MCAIYIAAAQILREMNPGKHKNSVKLRDPVSRGLYRSTEHPALEISGFSRINVMSREVKGYCYFFNPNIHLKTDTRRQTSYVEYVNTTDDRRIRMICQMELSVTFSTKKAQTTIQD